MTRSKEEFDLVLTLLAEGRTDSEVSRLTNIPRSTVRAWRLGISRDTFRLPQGDTGCGRGHDFSTLPCAPYGYLLGVYLGDGCISQCHRVWKLRLVLDAQYPDIIQECGQAMEAVMPGQKSHRLYRPSRCVEVSMYSKHWPCLFPQHGPGRKHERPILLESWQEGIVTKVPRNFVRGLIHSDGCRVIANDRGVRSVRYHFSNKSDDIKRLFCTSLDALGIRWTRPCDRQIAIYRKEAVARLDQFIGPKH